MSSFWFSKKIALVTTLLVSGLFLAGIFFVSAFAPGQVVEGVNFSGGLNYDFGLLESGEEKSLLVKVENTNDVPVSFKLAQQTHPYFNARQVSTVGAGQKSSIVVKFEPLTDGEFNGELNFTIPEFADKLVSVKVAGSVLPSETMAATTVTGGKVAFLNRGLDFLELALGRFEEQTILVENQGTTSQNVTLKIEGNNADEFFINTSNFNLAAGSRKAVMVKFNPDHVGTKTAKLVMSANDVYMSEITLNASAKARNSVSRNLVSLLNFTQLSGPDYLPFGGSGSFDFALNYSADQVSGFVEKDGVVLASLTPDYLQGQTGTFSWNGLMKDGTQALDGRYRVVIDAYSDAYGAAVTHKVFTIGDTSDSAPSSSVAVIELEDPAVTAETTVVNDQGETVKAGLPVFTGLSLVKSELNNAASQDYAQFNYDLLEESEVQVLVKTMPDRKFVTWLTLPVIKDAGFQKVYWDAKDYIRRNLLTAGFYELRVIAESRIDGRKTIDSVYVVVNSEGVVTEVDQNRRSLDGSGFPTNAPVGVNTADEILSQQLLDTSLTRMETAALLVALLEFDPVLLPNTDKIDFGFDDLIYDEEWLVSPMKHFMAITLNAKTDSTGIILKTVFSGYTEANELRPDQKIVRSEFYKAAAEGFYNQRGGTNLVLDRNPKEFCVNDVSAKNPTWYMPYVEMLCEQTPESDLKTALIADGTFEADADVTIREALLFMVEAKKLGWW